MLQIKLMKTLAQYQRNRTRKDTFFRKLVTFFGIGVLVTMLIMIWHLLSQTVPFLFNPTLRLIDTVPLISSQQSSIQTGAIQQMFNSQTNANNVSEGYPKDNILTPGAIESKATSLNDSELFAVPASLLKTLAGEQHLLILSDAKQFIGYRANEFNVYNQTGVNVGRYEVSADINSLLSIEKNRSLFVAYGDNAVERWVLSNQAGHFVYTPTYAIHLNIHEQPRLVKAHGTSNAAVMLTNLDRLILFNRITGEQLSTLELTSSPQLFDVIDNRIFIAYLDKIDVIQIKNLAGTLTFKELFLPQIYEGYNTPKHIYQTSAGNDFNESKYALTPLFIGSIKAAISALLIAIPIALGAAVFTGYFAPKYWRHRLKSIIEMLEAIPSVVLGFIAAVLLIPVAEQILVALALFILTVPCLALLLVLLQNKSMKLLPRSLRFGTQILLACLSISLWGVTCFYFAPDIIDPMLFSGSTKNTLVVSIALGLAISPTIFTLAEDAIYSVPNTLKNASFALGATPLQTLSKVVLRVAMPGLIAAVMLGFGRAIGETMIVLMVTGNTPIPDWSLFESLRAITANIAIELTEAEVGSALYTVLFFTATCLFLFTFIFNTLAEGLKYRMRKQVNYV